MATGRPVSLIELSEGERSKLALIASRPKTSQRDALRARIVLEAAAGGSNLDIARKLGVSNVTVGKWRSRFATERLGGLVDAPRTGAPRRIADEKVEEVVTRTLETKPRAKTHWSTRSMSRACGISHDSVRRIWGAFGLKPHLVNSFKLSTDPMFVEKVRDIVGLYLNPPDKAMVFCIDEKSQTQALERSQPILPMRPGLPEAQTHDYIRHGTTSLFAALNVLTGEVTGSLHRRHRHQEFLRFLNHIDKTIPEIEGVEIHIVMDNYGTHKVDKVKRWFAKRPRYHLHFTPTGSSWINQIERWFAKLTEECIRRGSFTSVPVLEAAIREYIEEHNREPSPFVWTATAESIFEKLQSAIFVEEAS
jgi:transposase